MRRVVLGIAFVLALSSCGDGGNDESAEEPSSPPSVAPPQCDELWVEGNPLPAGYSGCISGAGTLAAPAVVECTDGRTLVEFGSSGLAAFVGEPIALDESGQMRAECDPDAAPVAPDGEGEVVGGDPLLVVDQPLVIGPDDDGDTAEVTLAAVSYPTPDSGDAGSIEAGNTWVKIDWTIRNTGEPDIYGIPVYPSFETADGQVRDAEWEIALLGDYGSPGFEDEMPDSLRSGQFAAGWNIYEVPATSGTLIFPYGPGEVRVAVEPPS